MFFRVLGGYGKLAAAALVAFFVSACGGGGGDGGVFPVFPPVQPPVEVVPVKIAAFGDSLQAGGVDDEGREGFPAKSITRASGGRIEMLDYAYGGVTTQNAMDGTPPPFGGVPFRELVRTIDAPIVMLRYGGAEAVINGDSPYFRRNMEQLIQWSIDAGKQVILVGKITIPDQKDVPGELQYNYLKNHATLQDLANRWGLEFIDISQVEGTVKEMYDPIHPGVNYQNRHSAAITVRLLEILDKAQALKPHDPHSVIRAAKKILVFATHPDDETLMSPLLKEVCQTAQCKIISATAGGGSGEICTPSGVTCAEVVRIRNEEFNRAAAFLNFTPVISDFPYRDGKHLELAYQQWDHHAAGWGGVSAVVQAQIAGFEPDVVLTFDPRHGTTCHDEHMLTGEVVYRALKDWTFPKDKVFFLETMLSFNGTADGGGFGVFVPGDEKTYIYDMRDQWGVVVDLLHLYSSQFDEAWRTNAVHASVANRKLAWQTLADYNPQDPRYNYCR